VSKTTTNVRSLVSLDLPKTVPELISFAEQVVKSVTNNPSFPTPSPTIAVIQQAIADLQAAQAAAQLRAADEDPDTSATVIHGAGLAVKKAPSRKPHTFAWAAKAG
jgi:hypothetical protein